MAWRYRKSFKVFPGVRLNVGKRGISTTIGVRGMSVNVSNRGTYLNTGIPGTGFSVRQRLDTPAPPPSLPSAAPEPPPAYTLAELQLPGAIKSAATDTLTSDGLADLRALLLAAVTEARAIRAELSQAQQRREAIQQQERALKQQFFGLGALLFKKRLATLQSELADLAAHEAELQEQHRLCTVPLDTELDAAFTQGFAALGVAFTAAASCEAIWDTTAAVANNRIATRSAAGTTVTRARVRFACEGSALLPCVSTPYHLENANGGDLYLYPGFVLCYDDAASFALIAWPDMDVVVRLVPFIESEAVPSDSRVLGQTWQYVNKDGSPDRRFTANRVLPIMEYTDLLFTTAGGVNEAYCLSNAEKAWALHQALLDYKALFVA